MLLPSASSTLGSIRSAPADGSLRRPRDTWCGSKSTHGSAVASCSSIARNGEDVEHTGEYLEIDRPKRLVFSFAVPKYSSTYTRVAIDIAPAGAGCDLTLVHEGVLPEYQERTQSGWTAILDALAANSAPSARA
jgi:hypothetical protein